MTQERKRTPFADRLDPEHRAALDLAPDGMLDLRDIGKARALTAELLAAASARQPVVEDVEVRDERISRPGGVSTGVRIYRPAGLPGQAPALLYIHGGGMVLGEVSHFDAQCAEMAAGAGCVVASVDYRLAPEHPYPAGLEDCYAAASWLHRESEVLGIDHRRIAIGGTSAGGGLAAGLALLARDRGEFAVLFQFLEAPMLDHRNVTASSHYMTHPKVWNREANETAWNAYLGPDGHATGVPGYASPAIADDLVGLPPVYLCVSALDLFVDECIAYAARLISADVAVELHVYPNGFHGSPRALPSAPISRRWRLDVSAALERAFQT